MNQIPKQKDVITIGYFIKLTGLSRNTIKKFIINKQLVGYKSSLNNGGYVIDKTSAIAFLVSNNAIVESNLLKIKVAVISSDKDFSLNLSKSDLVKQYILEFIDIPFDLGKLKLFKPDFILIDKLKPIKLITILKYLLLLNFRNKTILLSSFQNISNIEIYKINRHMVTKEPSVINAIIEDLILNNERI